MSINQDSLKLLSCLWIPSVSLGDDCCKGQRHDPLNKNNIAAKMWGK